MKKTKLNIKAKIISAGALASAFLIGAAPMTAFAQVPDTADVTECYYRLCGFSDSKAGTRSYQEFMENN